MKLQSIHRFTSEFTNGTALHCKSQTIRSSLCDNTLLVLAHMHARALCQAPEQSIIGELL